MLNTIDLLASKLKIPIKQVQIVLELLDSGATIPFIARYRKNMIGELNEENLAIIHQNFIYIEDLNKRKQAIIKILEEKDLLTPILKQEILQAETKVLLESLYEPFKEGRKTKATIAVALGLKPLAEAIFKTTDATFNPYEEARKYLGSKIKTIDFALENTKWIIAEFMAQDPKTRKITYKQLFHYGKIVSKKKRNAVDEKQKFEQYYQRSEPVISIPNHRVLGMVRGEKLKILNLDIEYNKSKLRYDLNNYFFKIKTTGKLILEALDDALARLIIPSVKRQIMKELFERSSKDAIALFANNLEEILLSPAIKGKRIIALDPGFISGCKVAVLSANGDVLDIDVIKPHQPINDLNGSIKIMNNLINKHQIELIVIGNGTASRETEQFVASLIKQNQHDLKYAVVSEVGASVYSASKIAIKEFPNLSVEQRSAIHIGRKFQDPLNEIVKIDPKAIGVGQYQHDVDQKELKEALRFKINKVVNQVGVNLNTATTAILEHISGLNQKLAHNIVEHRQENGLFQNRNSLKKVKGLGAKTFEQAVGFLRIYNSKNFYDQTAIHPESYALADRIVEAIKLDLKNPPKLTKFKANILLLAEQVQSNKYDTELIVNSLLEPKKDIRDEKEGYILRSDVLTMKDLKLDMEFKGVVQNITDFGIFVYIGLKQSVFVHVSQMSNNYIKHPSEILKNNQQVTIKIIEINREKDQIKGKVIEI